MATKTVVEELVDHIAADYLAKTNDETVGFAYGELERAREDKPRRIVFVELGGTIAAPKHSGGVFVKDGTEGAELRFRDTVDVQAHIYAGSNGDVQAIHRNLLLIFADCFSKAIEFQSYTWVTEQEGNARHTNRGRKLVQPFVVHTGIAADMLTLAAVDVSGLTHECEIGAGEFDLAEFSRDFKLTGGEDD